MVENERRWAISCYIPIVNIVFCVLALIRGAGSPFVNFHGRQGLICFCTWFVTILVALVSQTLSLMLWGVVLLLHVSGIAIAAKKSNFHIPFVGQLADLIPQYYVYELLTGKKFEKTN